MLQLIQSIQKTLIKPFPTNKKLTYSYSSSQIPPEKGKSYHTVFKLSLSVTNVSNDPISFHQTFPELSFKLNPNCEYIFPEEPARYSSKVGKYSANYGGRIPFPFAAVRNLGRYDGLMIASGNKQGRYKQIDFQKQEDGNIVFKCRYYDVYLEPEAEYRFDDVFVILFKTKNNFLRDTLDVYKDISGYWMAKNNQNERLGAFRSSFLMRVIELYQIEWHSSQRRVENLQKLSLQQLVKQDEQKLGPLKYIHLRDWAAQGRSLKGKFGNYLKQNLVGPSISIEWLGAQIKQLKQSNRQVGVYVEGYLLSKCLFQQKQLAQLSGLQMLDNQSKPYTQWGSINLVMCSNNSNWRSKLTHSILRIVQKLRVDAVYVDEYGFGSRTSPYKICTNYNQAHSHGSHNFDLQFGQLLTLTSIKDQLKKFGLVPDMYIEQTPNDASLGPITGSLSRSAIKAARNTQQIPILLARFAFPTHKIYQIITEYTMSEQDIVSNSNTVKQDVQQIKRAICIAFWNGNGIYVGKNITYYNKWVVEILRECNRSFDKYSTFFTTSSVQPLALCHLQKGVNQILANKFTTPDSYLLTLLNITPTIQSTTLCKCTLQLNNSTCLHNCQKLSIKMVPYSIGVYTNLQYTQIAQF